MTGQPRDVTVLHVEHGSRVAAITDDAGPRAMLDAHGDFDTPEATESGLLDGTPLATITGRCRGRLAAAVPGFRGTGTT